jgi:tetraacyldisaccharide 4'-kinase
MTSPAHSLLAPLGVAYGAAVRARLALYRAGLLSVREIDTPVLSVGNITAGGTGKTPLVEWVARALAAEGRRVCVLTRGYGRGDERRRVVVSDGARLLASAGEGGDEPRLLAERLRARGVAVVSQADRFAAALWARESLGSEVFVLDDGFQHLRLARALDIVTLDATNPWGGGRLLPAGLLREPRAGLRRAGCVVITRAEQAADLPALREEATRLSGGRPVFTARTITRGVLPLAHGGTSDEKSSGVGTSSENSSGGESPSALLQVSAVPRPVAAFCAVGNPRAFFAQLRREGLEPAHARAFADHHAYTQADIDALAAASGRAGARSLVTTAKDAVKLRGLSFALPCFVLEIGLELDDADGLLALVREAAAKRWTRDAER